MATTNPNMKWGKTFSLQAFCNIHGIVTKSINTVPYKNKSGEDRIMLTYSSVREADGIIPLCSDLSVNDKKQIVRADNPETILASDQVKVSEVQNIDPITGEVESFNMLHLAHEANSAVACSLFE